MANRTRGHEIKFRLNDAELEELNFNAKCAGMTREKFIRTVLAGKTPVAIPPAPYFDLTREVHALGNIMNQLARKAHSLGYINAPDYKRHAEKVIALADRLTLVCLPRDGNENGND